MRIQKVKDIEDCFDGSFIKEILFNEAISKDFIQFLGKEDKMQYFDSFARPFFKISRNGLYEAKGVEGNRSIRITLKQKDSLIQFEALVREFTNKL